jgi:hypothetical protein
MCYGIGPKFLEHCYWVLKGLARFSLGHHLVLDIILPTAYPVAHRWAKALGQAQTPTRAPVAQATCGCLQLCGVASCRHHRRHCRTQQGRGRLVVVSRAEG